MYKQEISSHSTAHGPSPRAGGGAGSRLLSPVPLLSHSYVPVQPENPHPAVRSSSSPCNSKLTLCFFKLKLPERRSGGRKGAACRALLSLMCKSQLPKTEVNQWKRPLGVGEGSSWPFPQPGSMLLCTGICSPDIYLFQ